MTWVKRIVFWFVLMIGISFNCYGYDREKDFGGWIDLDGDGQNTREEVLERDSLVGVEKDTYGNISWGIWFCPYSGLFFDNPKMLDIDHFVPLAEVYESGGDEWEKNKKINYANYLLDKQHLVVTWKKYNRSKGSKDIGEWLPLIYVEEYIYLWWKIKNDWNLCFDKKEIEKLKGYDIIEENLCKER